jgi:hypothetical protein
MARFPSPLIEPDVPISGIRLSDWLHRMTDGSLSHASGSNGSGLRLCLRHAVELPLKDPDLPVLPGSSPITRSSPSSKAHQKSGSFPPSELPGFIGTMTLWYYDPVRLPPQPPPNVGVEVATPAATGLPRCPNHLPDVPCPLPRRTAQVRMSMTSLPAWPSPFRWRVGIRDFTFEACSDFTHVTARWVAQPPKAAASTGYPCLRGTRAKPGKGGAARCRHT